MIEAVVILLQAGEEQWGTDEAEIQSILCTRSYPQLRATMAAYKDIAERSLEEAVKSECSGTLEDGYLAIRKFTH